MRSVHGIISEILGREFEIECSRIEVRGRNDHEEPYYSGPGAITGGTEGPFAFRVFNTQAKTPEDSVRLARLAAEGSEPMRFFADDYHGTDWAGAWFIPTIDHGSTNQCVVRGEFQQLSTRLPLTEFDHPRNMTVNHYHGLIDLPMLSGVNVQRVRDGQIESESAYRDQTKLSFDDALVTIAADQERHRTTVTSTHGKDWGPPICEVGLADAFAFVAAAPIRPRISIRYFEKDALVFVRETPRDHRSGMPQVVARLGSPRDALWNVFLAFLRDCKAKQEFYSTPLSRMYSELVLASTGSIHALVLALVGAIEDVVTQIVGKPPEKAKGFPELKQYLADWTGDPELRGSAIKLLASNLSRESVHQHLKALIAKGVVTANHVAIWKELRPKVAHGKIVDYTDEQLFAKRNHLITMFYRVALRLLRYQGPMTDYTSTPPATLDFRWTD